MSSLFRSRPREILLPYGRPPGISAGEGIATWSIWSEWPVKLVSSEWKPIVAYVYCSPRPMSWQCVCDITVTNGQVPCRNIDCEWRLTSVRNTLPHYTWDTRHELANTCFIQLAWGDCHAGVMLQNISFVDSPKNVPLNGSEASDITCKFPVPVDQNFHFRFLKSVTLYMKSR